MEICRHCRKYIIRSELYTNNEFHSLAQCRAQLDRATLDVIAFVVDRNIKSWRKSHIPLVEAAAAVGIFECRLDRENAS